MDKKIQLIEGDITRLKVDAVVNAANTTLGLGSGVNGAIHRAAGPELLEECMTLGGCQTGLAKITRAYHLPAKYIIHTVGPVWQGGSHGEPMQLASCYRTSLQLALDYNIETIAFPAISCGVFGYPIDKAAQIAVKEVKLFLNLHEQVKTVYFICFNDEIYEAYQQSLNDE